MNFIALISVLYSFYINEKEISKNKITGFYSLFLLCLSGLLGILVTNDIFNLYVFLEISSLSSYAISFQWEGIKKPWLQHLNI
ncbi:NADH dehydrogenase domain protein [Wolbachia pipientis wUni]|nr:NADH dehydrogenase domain protein [Wolbachia pipientis wUni]